VSIIVFRPGSVQDPGSGFWPGHRVARVNSLKKNQNDIVLVKKQKSTGCNWVFDWVLSGQLGFFFPCFFFNLTRFQPRVNRVPDQSTRSGRVLKLWCKYAFSFIYWFSVVLLEMSVTSSKQTMRAEERIVVSWTQIKNHRAHIIAEEISFLDHSSWVKYFMLLLPMLCLEKQNKAAML